VVSSGSASRSASPPSVIAIAHLRDNLAHLITHGAPGQRKALIETHIAEITIQGDTLTPTFMIPTGYNEPATTTQRWSVNYRQQ
jgi:hypothetical protein